MASSVSVLGQVGRIAGEGGIVEDAWVRVRGSNDPGTSHA